MAGTTLSQINASEMEMTWKEPYLTAGLNAKVGVHTPPGTYAGFRLTTDAANLHITISPDPTGNDHRAFYLSGTGYGLSIWKKGGSFSLDLTAFVNKTVLIALYANYTLGSNTTGEIRAYQISPVDEFSGAAERNEIVILGKVVVPAAGLIPAGNITHDKRTEAWSGVSTDAAPWTPLLRNGDFEWNDGGTKKWSVAFWEHDEATSWTSTHTDFHSGYWAGLLLGTGMAQTGSFYQFVHIPVKAGELVRVRFWTKVVQTSTAGSMAAFVEWSDHQNANFTTTTIAVATNAVDASWRLVEQTITVPAGVYHLRRIGLQVTGINFTNAAAAVYYDDFQAYVERKSELESHWHQERKAAPLYGGSLIFGDTNQNMLADELAMWWDKAAFNGEGSLWGGYKNAGGQTFAPIFQWLGRLVLGGRLVSNQNQAAKPRVHADYLTGGTFFTLMAEYGQTGSGYARLYMSATGEYVLSFNCNWHTTNANQWTKDVDNVVAWTIRYRQDFILTMTWMTPGAGGGWGENGWTETRIGHLHSLLHDPARSSMPGIYCYSRNHTSIVIKPMRAFQVRDNAGVYRTIEVNGDTTLTVLDVLPSVVNFTGDTWHYIYAKIDEITGNQKIFISTTAPSFNDFTQYPYMNGNIGYRYLSSFYVMANGLIRAFTNQNGLHIHDEVDPFWAIALNGGNSTLGASFNVAPFVPPHARWRVWARLRAQNSSTTSRFAVLRPTGGIVSSTVELEVAAAHVIDLVPNYSNGRADKDTFLHTNDSGFIEYVVSHNSMTLYVDIRGWQDRIR